MCFDTAATSVFIPTTSCLTLTQCLQKKPSNKEGHSVGVIITASFIFFFFYRTPPLLVFPGLSMFVAVGRVFPLKRTRANYDVNVDRPGSCWLMSQLRVLAFILPNYLSVDHILMLTLHRRDTDCRFICTDNERTGHRRQRWSCQLVLNRIQKCSQMYTERFKID